MTKRTCKTCKWWGTKGEHSLDKFADRCVSWKSPKYGTFTDESFVCDKYESVDRQEELKLRRE